MSAKKIFIAAMFAPLALLGCRGKEDLSPPQIAYGQTECEFCRMIVSDESFAAAAVFRAEGAVAKVAFDDVGCLIDYLKQHPETASATNYVHDQQSRAWVRAEQAFFVRSERLQTPMGSNLAACASRGAADELLKQYPGRIVQFADLTSAPAGHLEVSNERMSP